MDSQETLDNINSFPKRLKMAIGNKSARAFAIECGLSPTGLHQYLSGKSEPTRPAILAIANTAKVNLEWLITGEGEQTSRDACDHPLHSGAFPKELDTDLLQQVTDAIDNIVNKKGFSIPKDRLTKVTMLAYTDAFWRGRRVNYEHLESILEVTSVKEVGLTKAEVFREAALGGLGGGFVVGGKLPQAQGWLGDIKVFEITAEKVDDGNKIVAKILQESGINPDRSLEIRARQLKALFEETYEKYRHIVVVINNAHILSTSSLQSLKSIHEIPDKGSLPGIVLLGRLVELSNSIATVESIKQRALLMTEQEHLVELMAA
jgi:transcriptional regulator with XRE-family HTH domain